VDPSRRRADAEHQRPPHPTPARTQRGARLASPTLAGIPTTGRGYLALVTDIVPLSEAELRRRNVRALRKIADTEDAVAKTFEQLARTGGPEHRARRSERAESARAGAAAARQFAGQLEGRT
jgi:hypothetical protein